jgi:hypothetical protein
LKLLCLLALPMAELCAQSIKTGPEVGRQVPAFSATDQSGRTQDLKSIMAPKGACRSFWSVGRLHKSAFDSSCKY